MMGPGNLVNSIKLLVPINNLVKMKDPSLYMKTPFLKHYSVFSNHADWISD